MYSDLNYRLSAHKKKNRKRKKKLPKIESIKKIGNARIKIEKGMEKIAQMPKARFTFYQLHRISKTNSVVVARKFSVCALSSLSIDSSVGASHE